MAANSLQDLYQDKLKDIYDAEHQGLEAMTQMAAKTEHAELRRGLEAHARQTEEQIRRLEQLFEKHGKKPERKTCAGMKGIVAEGQQHMKEAKDPDARDAVIICSAQAVEHYEIAGYGTARTWARQLGLEDDARVLQQTLDEEGQADKLLTQVAESMVNRDAAK